MALVWAAAEVFGEPLLRWEYRYRGNHSNPVVLDATYVGLTGSREVRADTLAEGCPIVLFVRPSPPLWRQAISQIRSLTL